MKKMIAAGIAIVLLFSLDRCLPPTITVGEKPVAPTVVRPVMPGPDYIWIEGEWYWSHGSYAYRQGYWARARPNRVWTTGQWVRRGNGWYWQKGTWH